MAAAISLSLLLFIYSSTPCIASLRILVLLLFLTLLMLSLESKVLCIEIKFLVLCFICLNSFLVQFKKNPEQLTREILNVFIPLIRFLRQSLLSRSFLLLLKYPSLNCDTMRCISFPFVLAPFRRSLCLFWRENHTKDWRRDLPRDWKGRKEGRSQRRLKEPVDKARQRRTVGLR